jgi:hypothetical protein
MVCKMPRHAYKSSLYGRPKMSYAIEKFFVLNDNAVAELGGEIIVEEDVVSDRQFLPVLKYDKPACFFPTR